jgi:tight adherence protein C
VIIDTTAMLVSGLSVAALAFLVTGIREISGRGSEDVARRIRPGGAAPLEDRGAARAGAADAVARALTPIARLARPTRTDEVDRLNSQLAHGGLRGSVAPQIFLASKMLGAGAGLALYFAIGSRVSGSAAFGPGLAVLLFAMGYYTPSAWLSSRIRARQTAIERALPDTLDLLVTCVEAGLGLDAALQRVASELTLAAPVLAGELRQVFLEINAGIRRVEAMRRLAARTGVADLKSLAATLNQTEMFGTSIGAALRIQAEGMRTRRMQRAEERAAMASVRLMIPLVVCVLPSLMAVILGPAIVNIVLTLLPAMAKGGR